MCSTILTRWKSLVRIRRRPLDLRRFTAQPSGNKSGNAEIHAARPVITDGVQHAASRHKALAKKNASGGTASTGRSGRRLVSSTGVQ